MACTMNGTQIIDFTTTDDAWTTVCSMEIDENNSGYGRADILAVNASGTTAFWERAGVFKRGTGTGAVVGALTSITTPVKDAAATLWDTRVVIDNDHLNFDVKGTSTETIYWSVQALGFGISRVQM